MLWICGSNVLMAKQVKEEGVFHLTSARHLLYCLEDALQRYRDSRIKRIEDVFFLVMGANHLREWIAPGYSPKFRDGLPSSPADTEAKKFYIRIFDNADFQIVRNVCNRAKHLSMQCEPTCCTGGLPIDEWDSIDNVVDFDKGPPTGFFVDETEIGGVLQRLLEEYRRDWFECEAAERVTS